MPKIAIELSDKEAEAIVWLTAHLIDFAHANDTQLEDDHIVRRLRMHGYTNVQIQEEGEALEDFAAKRLLPPALTAIQSEALKDAVEKKHGSSATRRTRSTCQVGKVLPKHSKLYAI